MNRKEQLEFIARMAPAAQQSQARFGVPASITLAQCILESGWGQSGLSRKALNFFGIKARRGEDYAAFDTLEFRNGIPGKELARFRKFKSEAECFEAHARLLAELPRYAKAMAAADDPIVFAQRLYECGYATDPQYPLKLKQLIERWDLGQWDLPGSRKRNGGPAR